MFEKNPQFKCASREGIDRAMGMVPGRAQAVGVAAPDVDGSGVIELVWPICTSSTLADGQAQRLLTMVLDGLRPPAAS